MDENSSVSDLDDFQVIAERAQVMGALGIHASEGGGNSLPTAARKRYPGRDFVAMGCGSHPPV
jgi:hypothetical protein